MPGLWADTNGGQDSKASKPANNRALTVEIFRISFNSSVGLFLPYQKGGSGKHAKIS